MQNQSYVTFLHPYLEEIKKIVETGSYLPIVQSRAKNEKVVGTMSDESKAWHLLLDNKIDESNGLIDKRQELLDTSEVYEKKFCLACSCKQGDDVYHHRLKEGQESHPDVAQVNEYEQKIRFLKWEIDLIRSIMWGSIEHSVQVWQKPLGLRSNWKIVELPEEESKHDDSIEDMIMSIVISDFDDE
jgi:hypothetical protein